MNTIVFGLCVGDPDRYRSIALPSIQRHMAQQDRVIVRGGEHGICRAYNHIIQEARALTDCGALVLLHEDVELSDLEFRAKALAAVRASSVGVAGVIGGAGLRDHTWWRGRRTAGFVLETRGPIAMGERQADVDVVDGLLLILSPAAFGGLQFDEPGFPAFHGYDVDYCLQARAAGLRVVVADVDVIHHTKTGYGDRAAWEAAGRVLAHKWPGFIRPPGVVWRARRWLARHVRRARGSLA